MTDDTDNESGSGISTKMSRRAALIGMGGLGGVAATGLLSDNGGSSQSQSTVTTTSSGPQQSGESLASQGIGEELSASIDEYRTGDKFGRVQLGGFAHTLQMSGTRHPVWMNQPFYRDMEISNSSYEQVGSNIGYGVIPFGPGQEPILRIVGHLENDSSATTSIRVSIANKPYYAPDNNLEPLDDGPTRQTILEVTGKGTTQVFDEAYLSDVHDVVSGMPNGSPLPINTFIVEAKTDSANATLKSESTISLEMEAL